jgi:hypothetical protein
LGDKTHAQSILDDVLSVQNPRCRNRTVKRDVSVDRRSIILMCPVKREDKESDLLIVHALNVLRLLS